MRKLQITITGEVASGKTVMARALGDFLKEKGAEVKHRCLDNPEYNALYQRTIESDSLLGGVDWSEFDIQINEKQDTGGSQTKDILNKIVDAWESLEGDRNYTRTEMEIWLAGDMSTAIQEAREVLGRKRPDDI